MSLEAVVFQRLQSSNVHGRREYTPSTRQGDDEPSIHHTFLPYYELPILRSGQYTHPAGSTTLISVASSSSSSMKSCNPVSNNVVGCWRKRRITRKRKRSGDEEEEEGDGEERQRKNHIQVERNRRKQMNNYLSLLRSCMPPSYSRRGEQASIVGGAINFVKELEQHLQCLQSHHHVHKRTRLHHQPTAPSVFSDFFNFPQYSTVTTLHGTEDAVADVEVTLSEQHVAVKVLTRNQPKQLLRLLAELSSAHLTILHLNVTSVDASVLYSFSLKREEECQLSTVKEIATAVHNMIRRIKHHPNLEL